MRNVSALLDIIVNDEIPAIAKLLVDGLKSQNVNVKQKNMELALELLFGKEEVADWKTLYGWKDNEN